MIRHWRGPGAVAAHPAGRFPLDRSNPKAPSPRPAAALRALIVLLACGTAAFAGSPAARLRRPAALGFGHGGDRLYVANACGTVSVIDPAAGRVLAEAEVGRALADLAPLPGGRHLLAVDRGGSALLLLEAGADSARVVARREVAADPVAVAVSPDGSSCAVTSTGSRRLTLVALAGIGDAGTPELGASRTLDLPFRPRGLAWVRTSDARPVLVVADAFGGKLAMVDPAKAALLSVRTLHAHNIRGLATNDGGRTLTLAHQTLGPRAEASFQDVHWGNLIGNHLQVLEVDALLAPEDETNPGRGRRLIHVGNSGTAAGDPSALAYRPDGSLVLALSGVDEVALATGPTRPLRRVDVGRRPVALALAPDARSVFVADELDDTITVVDVVAGMWLRTIALGARPEPDAVGRGERLFSDARVSLDGWMSCHSCHTDGQSNGLRADTLGDGSYGAPKRVPSLLGVGETGPWAWSGIAERLEDQVRKSVTLTMRGHAPSREELADLTAYLRSLQAAAPEAPAAAAGHEAAARGQAVFASRKCASCHAGPTFTKAETFDVGLADDLGNREFNPPSLRGVGGHEPLLHDGRSATLEDVFREHGHPRESKFTEAEVSDLAAYLRSL